MTMGPTMLPPGVFTVGELSSRLRAVLESSFPFVMVTGEISNCRSPASGHIYFDLKDADAIIGGVVWKGSALRLKHKPADGLQVIVHGRVTTYQSKLQLVVEYIEPAGLGAWLKLLEERKAKLQAEGLFDPDRKKPLPYLPDVIGVITSETGDVIHDILTRFKARGLRHVLVWPVKVQGEGAAEQVAAAIEGFNQFPKNGVPRPDVLIVARGGGSMEDLCAFNEEIVVRAVAASQIPIITGVGHEPDVTLVDYAADKRAATPTAAAELAVPMHSDLLRHVMLRREALTQSVQSLLRHSKMLLVAHRRSLPDLDRLLTQARLRLDDRTDRLFRAWHVGQDRRFSQVEVFRDRVSDRLLRQYFIHHTAGVERLATQLGKATSLYHGQLAQRVENLKARLLRQSPLKNIKQARASLNQMEALLRNLSPRAPLEKGYAYITDINGQVIKRSEALQAGLAQVHFYDGTREVEVKK